MTASSFKLYWWRRGGRWTNLWDEVLPLILGRVTVREIEHAGLEGCDGIAIGSVFYPRKATLKKRSSPMFVWGSGTLIPRPARFDRLFAILAALRGPILPARSRTAPRSPSAIPACSSPKLRRRRWAGRAMSG